MTSVFWLESRSNRHLPVSATSCFKEHFSSDRIPVPSLFPRKIRTGPWLREKEERLSSGSLITLRSSSSLRGTPLEKLHLTFLLSGSSLSTKWHFEELAPRTRETLSNSLKWSSLLRELVEAIVSVVAYENWKNL